MMYTQQDYDNVKLTVVDELEEFEVIRDSTAVAISYEDDNFKVTEMVDGEYQPNKYFDDFHPAFESFAEKMDKLGLSFGDYYDDYDDEEY